MSAFDPKRTSDDQSLNPHSGHFRYTSVTRYDALSCLGGGNETARLEMFYEPRKKNHGLPHDPYNAIVGPRPMGWITSINTKGELNLAPYSFFNSVSTDPPIVMFASDGRKDTIEFVEETGEFVCNLAVWDLRQQVQRHLVDLSPWFKRNGSGRP